VVEPGFARVASRAGAMLLGILALCFEEPAWACPSCTTRSGGGFMIPLLLGAMILTPYIVGTVVIRIVRKAEAARALEDEAARSTTSSQSSSHYVDPAGDSAPARA
jgi:hypothetical protein